MEGQRVWSARIPEVCHLQCDELRVEAGTNGVSDIDRFTLSCGDNGTVECTHEVTYEDETLENIGYRKRAVTVLNICVETSTELYAETSMFECPYAVKDQ